MRINSTMKPDTRKRKRTTYICNDILINILRRLTPIALVEFLKISKEWRALIESNHLLESYIPLTPIGIFQNNCFGGSIKEPILPFFQPILHHSDLVVNADLSFIQPCYHVSIESHCNGLLACTCSYIDGEFDGEFYCVCNPATRWWEMVPDVQPHDHYVICPTLAFDPTVSLHYELFCFLEIQEICTDPEILKLCVFSSRYRQWEDLCVLQPEASQLVCSMFGHNYYKIETSMSPLYRDKTLYIPTVDRLLRFQRGQEENYQVLHFPEANPRPLEKSFFGVLAGDICYAVLFGFRLRIWTFNEISMSNFQSTTTKWLLRHERDVGMCRILMKSIPGNNDTPLLLKCCSRLRILGFHPQLEMIYMHADEHVVAFDPYRSVLIDVGHLMLHHEGRNTGTKPPIVYLPCLLEQPQAFRPS